MDKRVKSTPTSGAPPTVVSVAREISHELANQIATLVCNLYLLEAASSDPDITKLTQRLRRSTDELSKLAQRLENISGVKVAMNSPLPVPGTPDMHRSRGNGRILLVEDNDSIREIVCDLVHHLSPSTTIIWANTIEKGRQFLGEQTYRMVILDQQLPDGRGRDLLPELLKSEHMATLVLDFSASLSEGQESNPHFKRIDGRLPKNDLQEGMKRWLSHCGFLSHTPLPESLSENLQTIDRLGRQELKKELQTLSLLIENGETALIALQAHKLVGLTGILKERDLSRLCETIEAFAKEGKLSQARQSWLFLKKLSPQTE